VHAAYTLFLTCSPCQRNGRTRSNIAVQQPPLLHAEANEGLAVEGALTEAATEGLAEKCIV
jgi:hypothetical protein